MKITDHIFHTRSMLRTLAPKAFTCQYLIVREKVCLIDSGLMYHVPEIFELLKSASLKPKDISLVVNTHGHIDHRSGNAWVRRISSAKIAAHELDAPWIENRDLYFKDEWTRFKESVPDFDECKTFYNSGIGESTSVDIRLIDGDLLDLGKGIFLKVIHTPGHTPGSISLYEDEDQALFTGACIQRPTGIGIYYDVDAEINSLRRLQQITKVKHVLGAHAFTEVGGQEIMTREEMCKHINKTIEHLQVVHETVLKALKDAQRPCNLIEIFLAVCRSFGISDKFARAYYFKVPVRLVTMEAHLHKLTAENRARRIIKKDEIFWEAA